MNRKKLKNLLRDIKKERITVDEAMGKLKDFPYSAIDEDIKVDTHRSLRRGFPEVVFGKNKSPDKILKIAQKLHEEGNDVLITKTGKETFELIEEKIPSAEFSSEAKTIVISEDKSVSKDAKVAVVSGGTSDTPVAEEAAVTVETFGNQVERIYDAGVAGIHRLLKHRRELGETKAVIAVAGMEGALPSVVGGLVDIPVIGVPTSVGYGSSFEGISALLTMLNSCAAGVVVVNIDNGFGAGYCASLMTKTIDDN